MFKEIASVDEILPGGMKAYEVNGKEIVLCRDDGKFYAFDRRCGHMSAPLDMGSLNGYIVTCPLHSVQFDANTGEALCGPVPGTPVVEPLPRSLVSQFAWIEAIMQHVKTCDIRTYKVKIENGRISVDV